MFLGNTQSFGKRRPIDAAGFVGLLIALAALIIFFGIVTENFLTFINFRTIANQVPAALIIATGMTFVLISGGIDLSVGSVLALSGAVLGVCLTKIGAPLWCGMLAAMGAGLLCGMLSGLVVARWRIPSFIVTLGMLEAARGAAYLVSDSRTQYVGSHIGRLAEVSIFGFSLSVTVALLVVVAAHVTLTRTVFGRHVRAVGANEETARLCGVRTRMLRLEVFALCGLLTGVAGIVHTARLSASDPNAGLGFELEAIAAVVIGGTSLSGGQGSVLRSVLGVLIIAVLGSGLAQAGAQEPAKRLITGLVIVGAVILDRYRRRADERG